MNPIRLVYWHTTTDNYGDLLSPFLVYELSGCEIIQKNYFVGNFKSHFYHTIHSLLHGDWNFRSRYHFPFESTVLGIGSILYTGNHRSLIWGAGFMSSDERCTGGTVLALRGKYSLEMIKQQIANGDSISLSKNVVLGDPALLLPLILSVSKHKQYKLGIIPHFSEVDWFKANYGDRFHIIDLRSTDIEGITRDITSCENILSTSLHGIIVPHAYGIPALWMEHTGLESYTKGFKFRDYFSSVAIDEYRPIKNLEEVLESEETAIKVLHTYKDVSLPNTDVAIIQKRLLSVAPFRLRKDFVIE